MCCPYFDPVAPRAHSFDDRAAMLPLGGFWEGTCRAEPLSPFTVDDSALALRCNLGYARGACARFPAANGPDALRFAVSIDRGASVTIRYVVECDHHPFRHGTLEYAREPRGWTAAAAGDAPERQARAYFSSYLRRLSEAAGE